MQLAKSRKIPAWNDAAIREVIQDQRGPFFIAALHASRLDDVAIQTYHAAPDDLARLGFAIARELDEEAPAVEPLAEDLRALRRAVMTELRRASRQPALLAAFFEHAVSPRYEARLFHSQGWSH